MPPLIRRPWGRTASWSSCGRCGFIPDYVQMPAASLATIRCVAHVNPDFTMAAINSVGASPAVESVVGQTPEFLRQEADQSNRWTVVEDELRAMLKGVTTANLVRKHRLGLAALQAYAVSRQLVRKEEHADLLPHVAEMKRLNTFGKRRGEGGAGAGAAGGSAVVEPRG
jgi:hypothetical protein